MYTYELVSCSDEVCAIWVGAAVAVSGNKDQGLDRPPDEAYCETLRRGSWICRAV